jgi:hypothetical protein
MMNFCSAALRWRHETCAGQSGVGGMNTPASAAFKKGPASFSSTVIMCGDERSQRRLCQPSFGGSSYDAACALKFIERTPCEVYFPG